MKYMMAPIGMSSLVEAVRKHKEGAIIDLFVTTSANVNKFPAGYNQWRKRIEIKVTSPPKGNKANFNVIKTCAAFFSIPVKNVWIISGKTSKEKTILAKNVSVMAAVNILKESLNGL